MNQPTDLDVETLRRHRRPARKPPPLRRVISHDRFSSLDRLATYPAFEGRQSHGCGV